MGLVLALIIWVGFFVFSEEGKLINPLGNGGRIDRTKSNYRVVGFLPTWMLGKTLNYCDEVTEMIFLGIEIDENGNLLKNIDYARYMGESYQLMAKKITDCGGKNVLGVKLFEDEKIEEFLRNDKARENFFRGLRALKVERGFEGVNIDFEFQKDPLMILEDEMQVFLEELRRENLGEISLDVFANTVIKGGSDLVEIINKLDYLVVMAYDFHRPGMDYAGPVAPIGSPIGERNIWEVVEKVVSLSLQKDKIVMAYPLYGYEWKTETSEYGSRVKRGWWALASYARMKEMDLSNGQMTWDEKSMSPWWTYEDEGEIKQIYFENKESLRRKFLLVEENGLGGVGFWALGYEGKDSEVWELLWKTLK